MIEGLSVIQEAVNRSVEMGKNIAFTTGYPPLTQPHRAPGVLAGLSVLGYTAKLAAERGVRTLVGCAFPDVFTMAQAITREAYKAAGAEEVYRFEDVYYMSPDQFAYGTGMVELCAREKPGSVFYIGQPLGESVLVCEGIKACGAIGIGATGRSFGAAATMSILLDYVLIGEELWAASAFVSQDPDLLAGISSQDVLKVIVMAFILLGTISIALLGKSGDFVNALWRI